jgi:hypothetical protein
LNNVECLCTRYTPLSTANAHDYLELKIFWRET